MLGNIETCEYFSSGNRARRPRKCTRSKCRKVLQALVADFFWHVVRFVVNGVFVVYCVFGGLLFFCGMCVFVVCCVFFVLWFVFVCLSKAVLECFFFTARRGWPFVGRKLWFISRRGRDCGCVWTRSCRCGNWRWFLDSVWWILCHSTLCPLQVMRAKFCVESYVVV